VAKERVQVRDLAPPERIQPGPLQSDTFAAPAAAPVNDDLERLSSALSHFGAGVGAYNEGLKKQQNEKNLAEYERFVASHTNPEIVEAFKAGKLPGQLDPISSGTISKDAGGRVAMLIARQLDEQQQAGIPGFGTEKFDAERHVLDQAAPYIEQMQGNAYALSGFNNAFDRVRSSFREAHERDLGDLRIRTMEQGARDHIRAAIVTGIKDAKLDGAGLQEALRPLYSTLGPRQKGGSLDIRYGRMDELVLEEAERLAANPEYAKSVQEMLHAPRKSLDGKSDLPPLAAVVRHDDKVSQIHRIAIKTLGDAAEDTVKRDLEQRVAKAVLAQDGSIYGLKDLDVVNPEDKSRRITYQAAALKEKGVEIALEAVRQRHGGDPTKSTAEELAVVTRNAVAHPEWIPALKGAYVGLAGSLSTNVGPDQVSAIIQSGEMYREIARNAGTNYMSKHLDRSENAFYELYNVLRSKEGGLTPEQAAANVARVYSSRLNAQDPNTEAMRRRQIEKAASRDFLEKSWATGALSYLPFSAMPAENQMEVIKRVTELANSYALTNAWSPERAVKMAAERVAGVAVNVNGNAIFDPSVEPGDVRHINKIFEVKFFKGETQEDRARIKALKDQGVEKPEDLSILPLDNGNFMIKKAGGGEVTIPRFKDGKIVGESPLWLSQQHLHMQRLWTHRHEAWNARKEAVEWNTKLKTARETPPISTAKAAQQRVEDFNETMMERRNPAVEAWEAVKRAVIDPWEVTEIKRNRD
jgi:hypothetical protein